MIRHITVLLALLASSVSFAASNPSKTDLAKVRALAQDFYMGTVEKNPGHPSYPGYPPGCYTPRPEQCVEEVCSKLSRFACDERQEILEISRACAGNYGSGCVTTVCNLIGRFNCDDLREVLPVAESCRGNWDGSCIQSVCNRAGAFECDDFREVDEVARACGGYSLARK